MSNSFLKPLPDTNANFYDVHAAVSTLSSEAFDSMPYTLRVLAEQLIRHCPEQYEPGLTQMIQRERQTDFPWYPARVVCHDILGLTALVDLAGLRNAIADEGGDPAQVNPVVPTQLIVDHSLAVEHGGFESDAFALNRAIEERRNKDRFEFIDWCQSAFSNVDVIPAGNGIMHQINLEKMSPVVQIKDGIAFPDTCVGTDSHTPHVDALGVLGIGVGGLEAETVMLGQPSMMRVPDIVGVEMIGERSEGVTATDIVLALTEFLRDSDVVSCYLEFFGQGTHNLSIGDRATISNMTPEYGATAGLFYIDEQTLSYLRLTGRSAEQVSLVEQYAKSAGLWFDQLTEVSYDRTLAFDLSSVTRTMAGPSNPHRRVATDQLVEKGIASSQDLQFPLNKTDELPDGAVLIAAITSCTNTSNPRNVISAALLAKNAAEKGLVRQPWVKTSFAPGSKVVRHYLEAAGLLEPMKTLGFDIVAYACTTCNGMSGALNEMIEKEVVSRDLYSTAVLSGNRNFDGRIHPLVKHAFLASPALVIAYAIAGSIRCDIERDVLGHDNLGHPVFLRDIWPSDSEIDAIVDACVKPKQFHDVYIPMFEVQDKATVSSPLYNWKPTSTYIQRPPYWEGSVSKPRSLLEMRALAVLGDNITTDHLSPSNAILPESAAGEYLARMGLSKEDFNSYATHRGDHLTAQRATLANPKLLNYMVLDDQGQARPGSLARLEPEGRVDRMWEVIETYREREQNLIVIAGDHYGQGSSRDWAAKGVRLAGVEVILAQGFERIHRTNLVGMGILPLQFRSGESWRMHQLDGSESYSVKGDIEPNGTMIVTVTRTNNEVFDITVSCRLETEDELGVYQAGGVLQRFAQQFLSGEVDVA